MADESAAVEIDIDQIENEVNNQQDDDDVDSVTFDADWQNDLKQLESALDTDSLDQVDVNQEQQEISAELEQVRQALEHDGIEPDQLLHDFYTHLDTDVLHVTSIPAEELQNEEQRRIQAEIGRVQHESEIQRRREAILHDRANKAKSELHEDAKRKQRLLQQKKDLIVLKARLEKENLQKSFSRAEKNLNKILTERQAEVKSLYGDLVVADEQYGGARGRRWRVEWTKSPQPVQIRIDCIRGLKDKIPVGRYAIMVSLYDRLGGHPMQWSTLEGARWGAATIPVAHSGKYFNSELKIDQSVFTVAPSKTQVQPGMVMTFELFLLRGSHAPTDVAVAWGAFPICDANFDIIAGPFKAPMLRGHMDKKIDRYERIEQLISADLDHWMANIYFDVVRLPRYLAGQKEYEVELQFSSGLLNAPDRVKTAESETFDGEALPVQSDELDEAAEPINQDEQLEMFGKDGLRRRNTTKDTQISDNVPTPVLGSKQAQMGYDVNDDDDDNDEKIESEWEKVEDEKGLYYKQHFMSPAYKFGQQVSALLPQNDRIRKILERAKPKRLSHLEQLERHKVTVVNEFMKSPNNVLGIGRQRMNYCMRVLWSELGLTQWKTKEFWVLMVVMAVIFFCRIYTHYAGMWIFIQAIGRGATVSKFDFKPYTVDLIYQMDLLSTGETVGMVLMGTLTNILLLSFMCLFAFSAIRLAGSFPNILSQSILMFALWTMFDPLAIMLVDACLGRFQTAQSQPIADAYLLYAHFILIENSGLVGIPITIFVYLVEIILTASIFYVYFLKLHNNGRLLDTYHRLNGSNDDFLVPYDQEVSAKELTYICRKAEAWRGIEGERRKTVVSNFTWKEKTDPVWEAMRKAQTEVTVHVAIFTVHLDGLRELYRQFLRLPDGAIIEVYDISTAALLPDVKAAFMRRQANFEEQAKRNEDFYKLQDETEPTESAA